MKYADHVTVNATKIYDFEWYRTLFRSLSHCFNKVPFRITNDRISRSDDTVIVNKQKTCRIGGKMNRQLYHCSLIVKFISSLISEPFANWNWFGNKTTLHVLDLGSHVRLRTYTASYQFQSRKARKLSSHVHHKKCRSCQLMGLLLQLTPPYTILLVLFIWNFDLD